MERFIKMPNVDLYHGVRITEDTVLDFKNDNVEQKVENLVLQTTLRAKGDGYESESHIKVYLTEGDVLIFVDENRGYIKPVEKLVTVDEAIEALTDVKEVVEDDVCTE